MTVRFAHVAITLASLACVASIGCGGSYDKEEETVRKSTRNVDSSADDAETDGDKVRPSKPAALAMIDRLPHEKIWFDNPLAIVSESGAAASPTETGGTPDVGTPETKKPAASSSGPVDWDTIATKEQVEDEMNAVRAYFTENLASVTTYNTSYLEVAPNVASIIAVSEVASRMKAEVAWKPHALTIRTLAQAMLADELRSGAKSWKQAKEPFDKIVAILDGKPPEGLEPGKPVPYEDLAVYMTDFMKRFKKSEDRMQGLAGGEGAFAKNKDAVKRESAVIGILGMLIMQEGFGYSDDEQFKGFAKPVVASSAKMIKAADAGDFGVFEIEMSTVSKNCTTCHMTFR